MLEHAGIACSRIRVRYGTWGKCDGGDAGTRLDVVSMDGGVLGFIQSYVDAPMICASPASIHLTANMSHQFEPMKNDLILRTARGEQHPYSIYAILN
jgi:hypothetical protein